MEQIDIYYVHNANSKVLSWAQNYRYDFYFYYNHETFIVETHGIQHYRENDFWRDSLKQEQENDENKMKLAQQYVDHYIVLDCRYSNLYHIQKSIMESQLPNLLNFNEYDVNWDACIIKRWLKEEVKVSKRASDTELKKKIIEYFTNTNKPNYRYMESNFHTEYKRLKRLINELVEEGRISGSPIKTRNRNH